MRRIFLATLLVFMMSATTALAADWQQIYTDQNDNAIYFDVDSVQASWRESENNTVFSAVFRMDYSERGRQALIDWYRDYSIMPAGIENLAYDISTIQFRNDGDRRYYYIAERTSYTSWGSRISGMHYTASSADWQEIPVGSVIDVEYFEAALIVNGKKYNENY